MTAVPEVSHDEDFAAFRAFLLMAAERGITVDWTKVPEVGSYVADVEQRIRVRTVGVSRRERYVVRCEVWRHQAEILYDAVFGKEGDDE